VVRVGAEGNATAPRIGVGIHFVLRFARPPRQKRGVRQSRADQNYLSRLVPPGMNFTFSPLSYPSSVLLFATDCNCYFYKPQRRLSGLVSSLPVLWTSSIRNTSFIWECQRIRTTIARRTQPGCSPPGRQRMEPNVRSAQHSSDAGAADPGGPPDRHNCRRARRSFA
jgi:hypothetical protein